KHWEESSKFQAPSSKEAPNFKLQKRARRHLKSGAWDFFGAWNLGTWNFSPCLPCRERFQLVPRILSRIPPPVRPGLRDGEEITVRLVFRLSPSNEAAAWYSGRRSCFEDVHRFHRLTPDPSERLSTF